MFRYGQGALWVDRGRTDISAGCRQGKANAFSTTVRGSRPGSGVNVPGTRGSIRAHAPRRSIPVSTYLLIHGAWHAAWCWYKVVPGLEQRGHTVIAPDLPGLGRDRTSLSRVSLSRWRDFVCNIVDAQPEPVILVGHSRGGIVISEVAEHRPERVRKLVYVAAYLPRSGESMFDLAARDPDSIVPSNLTMSEDKVFSTVRPEIIREAFYGCCSDEDVALARALLQPEPTLPMATAVKLTPERFGSVPRVYIECLRDKAITPVFQRHMHEATPCEQVMAIDTDHSPFLSRPDELVAHLHSL